MKVLMMMAIAILMNVLLCCVDHCNANKFDPYVDNAGTVVGICGDSFTVIAADTRLSDGVIRTI